MNEFDLTEEEKSALKELAQNLMAMGRAGRFLKAALLWLSGILVALWIIWDKLLFHVVNK